MLAFFKSNTPLTRGQQLFWVLIFTWHFAFFSTFYFLLNEWLSSHEFGYGTLVWAYSLYLLWTMRELYKDFGERLNILGFIGILTLGFCWLAASITSIEKIQQLAFIGILFSLLLAMGSWRLLQALFFPLLFMLLSIEVWKVLQIPLRDLSTDVTFKLVQNLGIPILREGYLLSLPGGRFMVEPACSGLSFFMVSLLLALIFSFERKLRVIGTIALSIVAVVVAVVSNWIRILIIVLVGNSTNMKSVLVQEHLIFGWVVYVVVMALFCIILYFLFSRKRIPENDKIDAVEASPTKADLTNEENNLTLGSASASKKTISAFCICVVLLLLPPVSQILLNQLGKNIDSNPVIEQLKIDPDIRKTGGFSKWKPNFINADETYFFNSTNESETIELYVARYLNQSRNKELINVHNIIYEDSYWRKIDTQALSVTLNKHTINGHLELIQHGPNDIRILFYWFAHADRTSGSTSGAKLDHLLGVLSGKGSSGSIVALMVPSEGKNSEASVDQIEKSLTKLFDSNQTTF